MASDQNTFIAVGGNKHPTAAQWSPHGTLAYGAGTCIALWNPNDASFRGVYSTLKGHPDGVNCVRFLPAEKEEDEILVSASRVLRVWKRSEGKRARVFELATEVDDAHDSSINALAVCPQRPNIFATGSADGTVAILEAERSESGAIMVSKIQTITTKPKFYALSLGIHELPGTAGAVLAIGGTQNGIVIYTSENASAEFKKQAVLTGHENWVRSLTFTHENPSDSTSDLLMASASQDKYIRLWRIHTGEELPAAAKESESRKIGFDTHLSNKAHMLRHEDGVWSITFEALLMGHEDWIQTSLWKPTAKSERELQVLSCSADNSITVWAQDEKGSAWNPASRFGDLSSLKGASTATGSAGGIWNALWSPDGTAVAALSRSGSWRVWRYDAGEDTWDKSVGITGHTRTVMGISWARDGGYLLTTSLDQTTRLYAQWLGRGAGSWHEFSRPQIHGYDMNTIVVVGPNQFVSGADEKLLRVFDEPKSVAAALERLCGLHKGIDTEALLNTAGLPVLGLSNKPIEQAPADPDEEEEPATRLEDLPEDMPPVENMLARLTLWPETEKLYGHGYEISALGATPHSSLIATACKASTIEHAVIRLFDGDNGWAEIRPPLKSHGLTVTTLEFSPSGKRLLSVGRDRAFSIFDQGEDGVWTRNEKRDKAHTRIIYGCSWIPSGQDKVFVTASRDKSIKVWQETDVDVDVEKKWETVATVKFDQPVTAVDVMGEVVGGRCWMMVGLENGALEVWAFEDGKWDSVEKKTVLDTRITPAQTITKITWRPSVKKESTTREVAVSSEDASVRVYKLKLE